jgi:hypothetical protein
MDNAYMPYLIWSLAYHNTAYEIMGVASQAHRINIQKIYSKHISH